MCIYINFIKGQIDPLPLNIQFLFFHGDNAKENHSFCGIWSECMISSLHCISKIRGIKVDLRIGVHSCLKYQGNKLKFYKV